MRSEFVLERKLMMCYWWVNVFEIIPPLKWCPFQPRQILQNSAPKTAIKLEAGVPSQGSSLASTLQRVHAVIAKITPPLHFSMWMLHSIRMDKFFISIRDQTVSVYLHPVAPVWRSRFEDEHLLWMKSFGLSGYWKMGEWRPYALLTEFASTAPQKT